MKFLVRAVTVLLTVILAVCSTGSQFASAAPVAIQASIGDSFAAGPGSGISAEDQSIYEAGTGRGGNECFRASTGYPVKVARDKGYALVNATCAGSLTDHILNGWNRTTSDGRTVFIPPQIDSIPSDASVVTITTGGNDIGFADFVSCILNLFNPLPVCDETQPAIQQARAKLQTVGEKVGNVIAAVKTKAPGAKVVITGYPKVVPLRGQPAPGCFPWLASIEQFIANDVEQQLNAAIKSAANSYGATFVDVYYSSGFVQPLPTDACSITPNRMINGVIIPFPEAALHPNNQGQHKGYAPAVRAVA